MDARERDEAIEVMSAAAWADCGRSDDPDMGAALDALTSPRTVECETCEGAGELAVNFALDALGPLSIESCEPCSGSGRIEKGPIAYLADSLVQVGWWFPNLTNRRLYPMGHSDSLYTEYDGQPVYFRLPTPPHRSANGTEPFTVEELRELTAENIPVTEVIPPRLGRLPEESPKGGA